MSREPQRSRSMFRSYAPADVLTVATFTIHCLTPEMPRRFLMSSDD